MPVGIEKIDLYGGRAFLEVADLARVRGVDPAYVNERLMCNQRSVYPVFEDAVTMSVNAARRVLASEDMKAIDTVVVATECGVDFAKSISLWVHRFCGLSPRCRNFEVKQACFAGTAALRAAASIVAATNDPSRKALVICTDFSSHHFLNAPFEFQGGGASIAMIVGMQPKIAEIHLTPAGIHAHECDDYGRPTSSTEDLAGDESMYTYLDGLEGAYADFEAQAGPLDYAQHFGGYVYHVPFPGMSLLAHRRLLQRQGRFTPDAVRASFDQRVAPGLRFTRRTGSSYGGTTFACLLGQLMGSTELEKNPRVSMFAYGGGGQAEFYSCSVVPGAQARVQSRGIDEHLDQRVQLSPEQYEQIERRRAELIDRPQYVAGHPNQEWLFEKLYAGRGLLVLEGLEGFKRKYAWS